VRQVEIRKAFERFLRERSLKLTPQRERIFDRVFATHEHFSAETMYHWLKQEPGPHVSRATVYRTLGLLLEAEFMKSLDTGRGELVYEHILGHAHHDHMLCLSCGRIEEFHDERIEELQLEACRKKGFELIRHDHRLIGYCRACAAARKRAPKTQDGAAHDTHADTTKEPASAAAPESANAGAVNATGARTTKTRGVR
jgi:Fur family ferric uptake transcriptional regulator